MSVRCVVFDADGVMIDSESFSIKYAKEFGISYEDMLPFFKGEFRKCLVGKGDLTEAVKPWLSSWNWDGSVDDFLLYWFRSEDKIDERMAETVRMLKERRILCVLATNQERYRTEYMKDQMGFASLFDKVYSSADIGYTKPAKEFFLHILADLGMDASDLMYFDDTNGHVQSARLLGIDAHVFEGYEGFEKLIKPFI